MPQVAATRPSTRPPTSVVARRAPSRSRSSIPARKAESVRPAQTPGALIKTPHPSGLILPPRAGKTKGQFMRIVAGAHRGRSLVAPKGHSTRPTADHTRQALFNVLEHAPWSPGLGGRRALDLFAGSGALGLEAISRRAAFCLFIDQDAQARTAVAENAAGLAAQALTRLDRRDATTLP